MYLGCISLSGFLAMSICGKFYRLPKRRVFRFLEVTANSTIHVLSRLAR